MADPTDLLRYMVSWASLGVSIVLLIGTFVMRGLIGPWCFFFCCCMHTVWAVQALVVCVVASHGIKEEIASVFATNVVFGQFTVKLLLAAAVGAFLLERRRP